MDTMSHLVRLDPDITLQPKSPGQAFSKPEQILPEGRRDDSQEKTVIHIMVQDWVTNPDPIQVQDKVPWGISDKELKRCQEKDHFCTKILD